MQTGWHAQLKAHGPSRTCNESKEEAEACGAATAQTSVTLRKVDVTCTAWEVDFVKCIGELTTQHKCAVVPRRARILGSWTFVSLNSRLERNKEEE